MKRYIIHTTGNDTMNVLKILSFIILINILSIGCHNKSELSNISSNPERTSHYTSIDGIWKCTPETCLKFPNGTLEAVIKINNDPNRELTVQGCFLWEGRYYDEWKLEKIQFNESTNQLTIVDNSGSTYYGVVDEDNRFITGIVYSGDPDNPVPEDKLDFKRAEKNLAARLFYPRLPDLDGSIKYVYQRPGQIEDGLQTAPIFEFTTDSMAIYNLMAGIIRQKYGRIESLLIMKDHKLVLEEYFYGYDRTKLHNIHSCTKSVTSLLMGNVLERQKISDIDQPLFNFFPQYESQKTAENGQITLKHVLTMTAGFQEEEGPQAHEPKDKLQYILSLPLESKPGETFRYSNDCSNLLGGIIYSLTGKHADVYAEEKLFGPMGISSYYWQSENGVPHCHSDLHMLPRDMAKIGLLVLNDGKWLTEQIVSKGWIYESTKPHVPESKFFDYGYHWWFRSKSNEPWWEKPDTRIREEYDKIIAFGYGGQYIMIIRDLKMVVVTTASDYGNGRRARSKIPMVVDGIVPIF